MKWRPRQLKSRSESNKPRRLHRKKWPHHINWQKTSKIRIECRNLQERLKVRRKWLLWVMTTCKYLTGRRARMLLTIEIQLNSSRKWDIPWKSPPKITTSSKAYLVERQNMHPLKTTGKILTNLSRWWRSARLLWAHLKRRRMLRGMRSRLIWRRMRFPK